MKIQLLVYPDMTLLDLVGPLQVWSMWPEVEVELVWKDRGPVMTDCGLAVVSTHSFEEASATPDILFAGGGRRAAGGGRRARGDDSRDGGSRRDRVHADSR